MKNEWEKIGEASVNDFGEPIPAVMAAIVDNFAPKEDRYEQIELILKSRPDQAYWFDVISDYISQDCEGSGGDCIVEEDNYDSDCDDHEHTELFPCTCGMEYMGGTAGTLKQCYEASTRLGQGLQPIDVARVIDFFADPQQSKYVSPEDRLKVIKWAKSEIEFEESFENSVEQDDED